MRDYSDVDPELIEAEAERPTRLLRPTIFTLDPLTDRHDPSEAKGVHKVRTLFF
jgi:hypothetical protein